ncbi:MAG: DJ-1/PfpI family protein [Candidatus Kapabacteria bacterium]|nr:DJ-1/PfpI family protein [Ignavibacteriota bacterium]MCW5885282.1 DJ-1/PfpI family protein [Candidatus Kapabacteria bacterium]
MSTAGMKIAILIESDYYENEIFYYKYRFPEEGIEIDFLSRLWGQEKLTFYGHEYKVPMDCFKSFEDMSDEQLAEYAAVIVPSGMVSDRLRYTEDVDKIPPATEFLIRAFSNKNILKGIICHGLWLTAPATELVKGRKLVCHNNLIGDAKAYGAVYVNEDVVVDSDLVTGRSGGHAHLFAKRIIEILNSK